MLRWGSQEAQTSDGAGLPGTLGPCRLRWAHRCGSHPPCDAAPRQAATPISGPDGPPDSAGTSEASTPHLGCLLLMFCYFLENSLSLQYFLKNDTNNGTHRWLRS